MQIVITDSQAPILEADLAALEGRLGIRYPDDYRQWLLKHNGGSPEPSGFRFGKGAYSDSMVNRFYAVYKGEYDNLEYKFRGLKIFNRRLPDPLVPIAGDPGGNVICISVSGNDRGSVYFWDHEEEGPEGAEPTYKNCHLIARSFTEFLNKLE